MFSLEEEDQVEEGFVHAIEIGDIQLRDISVSLGLEDPIFEGLNLKIPKGKLTILRGKNGAGKSTLLYLLMKVITISEGKILIDQINFNRIKRED